ncbi:helix-turn-helix domain-containing protein [Nesterenkonia sp. AY15]|uniref:helix-turn-helix domain-containing protein n=1 Tax=Nesterenkonia sp. AY15 TaxID=2901139 RepID=UPI001F4D2507|nr:helix-turn-helix transcriptional regulator [Nesterenkonia sp. AY15]MCH8571500.1 helix-turn-helix domain-containing protein [Nesterenkonia sp. AY15]
MRSEIPELPEDMDPEEAMEVINRPWEYNFRVNMARIREMSDISQTGLAKSLKAAGLPFHQQTVQRIEKGGKDGRPVRLNEAFVIAQVLGVELQTLLQPAKSSTPELSVSLYADRIQRDSYLMGESLTEQFADWCHHVSALLYEVREPVMEAVKQEDAAPNDVTLWCWAVAVRLVNSTQEIMNWIGLVNYELCAEELPSRPPETSSNDLMQEVAWYLGDDDLVYGELKQFLDVLMDKGNKCLEDVPRELNPFHVGDDTLSNILAKRPS